MVTKHDRYLGTLVGVLCGDALGAPYETWSAERIAQDLVLRGGLVPFDYPDPWKPERMFPKGRPTDDSDQTAAVAQSLIACRGVNQEDLYARLRQVTFDHKSPLWEGKAFGAGTTTRKMLRPATWQESQMLGSEGAFPSNGSLMRSAPLALFFGYEHAVSMCAIQQASEVTHRHPLAVECCIAYISVLTALLEGKEPTDGLKSAGERITDSELRNLLCHPEVFPRDPEVWPGRGAALLTLHVALYVLTCSNNFCSGLTTAIEVGGDTDTYGAVAGGLLGARFGVQDIPCNWHDVLIGREVMESLADKLFGLAHEQRRKT